MRVMFDARVSYEDGTTEPHIGYAVRSCCGWGVVLAEHTDHATYRAIKRAVIEQIRRGDRR